MYATTDPIDRASSGSCFFSGCIELDGSLAANIQSVSPSRTRRASSGSSGGSSLNEAPIRPSKRRQNSSGTITQFHSFQLLLEPPPSPQSDSMDLDNVQSPVVNFTGSEHIPNSLIQFGTISKVAATFTSVCPFSVEIPPRLFPTRPSQICDYSISARAWFRVTELASPQAPRLVSTPVTQATVSIRKMSHGVLEEDRRLDRMMSSMRGMDIEQDHVVVSPQPPYGGWDQSLRWRQ